MSPKTPWKSLAKTAGVGFVGGVILWGMGDVLGDFTTLFILRDRGVRLAEDSQELKDQIGHPYQVGPWYNAALGWAPGGYMAQCTFQLQGTKQITDVTVRALRGSGIANSALYNLFGSGKWTVVNCTAMFPAGGGLVQPRSLLPKTQPGAEGAPGSGPAAPAAAEPVPASQGTDSNAASPSASSHNSTAAPAQKQRTWWGWLTRQPKPTATSGDT